ncbi:DUF1283 domain-containing protein [Serratia marcescens]|uniref:DUF1283 domain-containing protein n=1 Tax=Serratia marcescens TaxID=615 RepID=A0A939NM85_SERMA|nr:DUF1283 domain-containing protein [Serratia marcescens]
MRHKVNTRVEKEFDKADRAADDEPLQRQQQRQRVLGAGHRKCTDRQTGRRITSLIRACGGRASETRPPLPYPYTGPLSKRMT